MDIETQKIIKTLEHHNIYKTTDDVMFIGIKDSIGNYRELMPDQIHYIANGSYENIMDILHMYNEIIKIVRDILEDMEY